MLDVWVVYCRPHDYPRHVVVRRQRAERYYHIICAPVACLYDSLDEAREDLERFGLYCLPRQPMDDRFIVETWV